MQSCAADGLTHISKLLNQYCLQGSCGCRPNSVKLTTRYPGQLLTGYSVSSHGVSTSTLDSRPNRRSFKYSPRRVSPSARAASEMLPAARSSAA
jgi:hypothetical protein